MTPGLLLRMRLRLGASPLRILDPLRVALDRELTALAKSASVRPPILIVRVDRDAQGDVDTMIPS